MSEKPSTPFDSIEGAHEYVQLLVEVVQEAQEEIREDLSLLRREDGDAARRVQALQLVAYKLERLEQHTRSSARILNDLRTLRRLLLGERTPHESARPDTGSARRERHHRSAHGPEPGLGL